MTLIFQRRATLVAGCSLRCACALCDTPPPSSPHLTERPPQPQRHMHDDSNRRGDDRLQGRAPLKGVKLDTKRPLIGGRNAKYDNVVW